MKKLSVLTICCFSMATQAGFNMRMPLEIKENGSLPDGSIVFINGSNPTTPTTPDQENPTDCISDMAGGSYIINQIADGETYDTKMYHGTRVSNGVKGKLTDPYPEYGMYVYEICMNGQTPKEYVEPVDDWANGECKYNTLGTAQSRFWTEANDDSVSGQHVFLNATIGDSGFFSSGSSGVQFLNFGSMYSYGLQVKSNSKAVYNGYTYYKGKLVRTTTNTYSHSENNGPVSVSDTYYYEVCRTK